jgi:PAS domain S-box-containing protein
MDHQAILDNAPLPILITQDLEIVYANQAFLDVAENYGYGLTSESVQRLSLMQFIASDEREASQHNIARLLVDDKKVHRNMPRKIVDAQGGQHSVLVSTSLIQWHDRPALVASFVILGLEFPSGEYAAIDGKRRSLDQRTNSLQRLTTREQQVAHLVASGYSTDNIAALLDVEESTVRSHIKAIFKKTKTRSRIELTRLIIGFK